MKTKKYEIANYDEWQFIEENLPNYHRRDDVLFNDIVSRYVNGEELSEEDTNQVEAEFESVEDAEKWLDNDIKRLFLEAFKSAYEEGRVTNIEIYQ